MVSAEVMVVFIDVRPRLPNFVSEVGISGRDIGSKSYWEDPDEQHVRDVVKRGDAIRLGRDEPSIYCEWGIGECVL